jgi:hypothetical protein
MFISMLRASVNGWIGWILEGGELQEQKPSVEAGGRRYELGVVGVQQ